LEERRKRPVREQQKDSLDQALEAEKQGLAKAQKQLDEQIMLVRQNAEGLEQEIEELYETGFVSKKPGVFLPDVPEAHGTEDEEEPGHEVGKELLYYLDERHTTLRKFFQTIDDGNGRIEKHEWMDGLRLIKFSNENMALRRAKDCAELFGAVDEDHTGSISWKELEGYFDELLKVVRSKHPVGKELVAFLKEEGLSLRKLWQQIDDGSDGKLSIDEFLIGMRSLGFMNESHTARNTATCKEFFLATDTDRSGIISWHEFQGVLNELQNGARQGKLQRLNKVATKKLHRLKDLERNAVTLRDKAHDLIRTSNHEGSLSLRLVTTEMHKSIEELGNQLRKLKFLKSQTEARVRHHNMALTWKDHADVHDDEVVRKNGREYAESPELIEAAEELDKVPVEEMGKDHTLSVLEGVLAKIKMDLKDKMETLQLNQNCQSARIAGDQLTSKPPTRIVPGDLSHGSLASTADTVSSRSGKLR
jgi:Ca2+-binding EF-hand superfamily protein